MLSSVHQIIKKKYGYKAVRAYQEAEYTVYPINPREKSIAGLPVYKRVVDIKEPIEIASFYVPSAIGEKIIDDVIRKGIKTVFVNPGAESDALLKKLNDAHIKVVQACSILAIGFHPEAFDE